jgi:hypothetical protein
MLHRDEIAARFDLAEVEDVNDVGMVQLRRKLRFVGEHRDELFVVGDVREDLLDRDDLLEPLDPAPARPEELCHAAAGDPLQDLVLPEAVRSRDLLRQGQLHGLAGRLGRVGRLRENGERGRRGPRPGGSPETRKRA